LVYEPPITAEDTQPRPVQEAEEGGGCANTLMITVIAFAAIFLFISTIALSGFIGWRDGVQARQGRQTATLATSIAQQAQLAATDIAGGVYELARQRCFYIRTLQPFNAEAQNCISTAQAGLAVTPTPTDAPATLTPTPSPTESGQTPQAPQTPGASGVSADELYNRAQAAAAENDLEAVIRWLEALRAFDVNYRRQEVEDQLVNTYLLLAQEYRNRAEYSQMIIQVRNAEKIRNVDATGWSFTANAATLYLQGRDFLAASDFTNAARVFDNLMEQAPTFSTDTKTLACSAFSQAGDTASAAQHGC
jgi:tetratricopeptide (TPR) repeat protein